MVLKCADIGHLAAAPATHKRWAYQLEEEFFKQVQAHSAQPLLLYVYVWDKYHPFVKRCMGTRLAGCFKGNAGLAMLQLGMLMHEGQYLLTLLGQSRLGHAAVHRVCKLLCSDACVGCRGIRRGPWGCPSAP